MSKNTKQLVPKLRFPEFWDAGEWEVKKLGDVSQIVRGGSPRPIDDYITTDPNGLNWLKIADVDKESKYVTSTKEKVHSSALSKTREVNPGDLIMSNSMSFGRPYILKIKSCIHDGWIAVTQIDGKTSRDYLYYLILSPKSQEYFVDNAAGSGVQNLNADIIKLLCVPIPKFSEQQKIADCLSSIDDLISAQSQKVEALKTHKKGLMHQLFPREGETVPRFRFPEFRDAWDKTQLKNLCISISSGRDVIDSEGQFNLYGSTSIIGKTKNPTFSGERLLVARVGANAGLLTKAHGVFGVTDNTLVITLNPNVNINFIYHFLGTININRLIFGSGQPLITGSILKDLSISLPSNPEQEKISACLSELEHLIELHTFKLEAIRKHKIGLMQQLFPSSVEIDI